MPSTAPAAPAAPAPVGARVSGATATGGAVTTTDISSFTPAEQAAFAAAARLAPAGSVQTSGGPTSSVIATSGASRAATTSNINTLQTALNNVPPPQGTPGSSTNGGANAQQNTSTGTTSAPSTTSGGSSSSSPSYTPPTTATQVSLPGGATGYYTPANGTTPESMTDGSGNPLTYSQSVGGWIDPTTGAAPTATSAISGSTGTDTNSSAVSGLPTNLQAIAKQNLDNLDDQYNQAQSAVTAAAATLANDPALASAISSIQAQYKVLYDAMGLKNQQVLGRANSEVGAFGGLGVMNQSFLSDEMDAAQSRLSDIVSKEQSAIVSAQAAYNKGDVAALNAATSDLKDAQAAKSAAVSQLLTATNNAVKDAQAQQKIDLTTQQDSLKSDVTNSTNLGASIASDLAGAGITDPDEIAAYVQQQAAANNLPEAFVSAAVTKAMQTATKASDSSANTASEIIDRNSNAANTTTKTNIAVSKAANPTTGGVKGGKDANYTYTAADVTAAQNVLQNGGAGYAAAGSDGYSDPGAYISLLNSWIGQGGTAAGFAKTFPVKKYVNPASYSKLPASIQPKAAAAPAAVPQ